jgi:hypothetical protein
MGIRQLQQMEEQSAISQQQAAIQQQNAAFQQQMQPLEMDKAKAAIEASRASTAQSVAGTAAQKVQTEGMQLTLDQRKQVGSAISAFNKDPETGIIELAKVAPYMDANTRDGIARSVPFYVNNQIDKAIASGKEITPEQYQKFSNALTLLPTAEQQQARNAILSMPQNLQTFTKSGVIGITNAALNDNRDAAVAASDEAAKALYNSNHPAAQVTAGLFDKLTNQLKDENVDLRKVPISALNISSLIQDKVFQGSLIDTLKEFNDMTKPSGTGAGKGKSQADGISDKQQDTINKLTFDSTQIRNTTAGFDEQLNLILDFAEQNPKEFKTGTLANVSNWATGKMGIAQQGKNLRSAFQRYATEDWVKRAEPLKGGLNKEEGERLERGVPDIMTATPAELLSFGRLVSKINLLDADQKDLNAAWQQNAESLQAKAPVEFEAAGLTVKPGDTWAKTQTKLLAGYKKKNEAQLQEDLLRLKRIEQAGKSGQSPVPNIYNLGGAPQPQQPAAAPNQSTISSDRQSLLNRYR